MLCIMHSVRRHLFLLFLGSMTACSGGVQDLSLSEVTPTSPAVSEQRMAVLQRLISVNNSEVKLGATGNRDFISIQMQAVGFSATEADCVARLIEKEVGPKFDQISVSGLSAANSLIAPDKLDPCVDVRRIQQLASDSKGPSFTAVNQQDLSELMQMWFSLGYERAGLTTTEASCVATRVIENVGAAQLGTLFGQGGAASVVLNEVLDLCVSADRLAVLATGN